MKEIRSSIILVLILFAVYSCKDDSNEDPNTDITPTTEIIEISTAMGDMTIYLYPETPIHRANFIKLAGSEMYNETEFHRIIPNFVIQGGDPLSKDDDRSNDGTGGIGETLDAEIDSSLFKHKYGAIGAARSGNATNPERKSNGSQFYICVNPDGSPHLDGEYTVFGEVIKGMDVALSIASLTTNQKDQPVDRTSMIMKVTNMTAKQIKEKFGFEVEL